MNNKEVKDFEEAVEMLKKKKSTIKSESITFANRVSLKQKTQHKNLKVKENN